MGEITTIATDAEKAIAADANKIAVGANTLARIEALLVATQDDAKADLAILWAHKGLEVFAIALFVAGYLLGKI